MKAKSAAGAISRLLLKAGDFLQFRPSSEFVTLRASDEKEPKKKRVFTPAFLRPEKKLKVKALLAKASEQSFLLGQYRRFVNRLFTAPVRSFGALIFTFGFFCAISYFSGRFLPEFSGNVQNLFIGLLLILISVAVAMDRNSVGDTLQNSFLFHRILKPVFGLTQREIPTGSSREHIGWMALGGAVLGILSVFFSAITVIGWCLVASCAALILYKPETGLVFVGLLFLLISEKWLCVLILATLFSFLLKAAVGKRSIRFCATDYLIFAGIGCILLPCVISGRPLGRGAGLCVILLLFFLASNLIRTLAWMKRVAFSLVFSLLIGGVSICIGGFLGHFLPDADPLLSKLGELLVIAPTKESGILLAELCPLALGFMRAETRFSRKIMLILIIFITMISLAFVGSGGLWVAFAVGLLVFFLFSYRSALLVIGMSVLALFSVYQALPTAFVNKTITFLGLDRFSFAAVQDKWRQAIERLRAALPWGTGLTDGAENAADTGSIYLRLGISFGIAGLLLFCGLLFLFFWKSRDFARNTTRKEIYPIVLGVICGVLIFLLLGVTSGAVNYKTISLFFLMISCPQAALLSCKREEIRLPY